jgi:type VI secretion system protein ImpJ
MFLRPHHFQASHRYQTDLGRRNHKWDLHYNWGLRSIELDLEALANNRIVIHSLEARFRDGTAVVVRNDVKLPSLDLRPIFQTAAAPTAKTVMIYLAVPALYVGRRNTTDQRERDCRYYADAIDYEDENTGGNPQLIPVRLLNLQLLVSGQDQTGLEVLPIARVERSAQQGGTPQLDVTYIPPLLACDAWSPLQSGILRDVYDRIDKKIDWLVQKIARQGITFDRHAPGDILVLKQLRELNEAHATLGVYLFAKGMHPLWVFLELSRVVGQLAIFGGTRQTPDLPPYNHDDLGTSFATIKRHLDVLFDIVEEPEYKERPFIGAALRMQVVLEPAWLSPSWQMFIGVQSELEPAQIVELLTRPGQMDMKVGSSERVDALFRQGAAGLRFVPVSPPPQALPRVAGQIYFQVMPDPKDPEWQSVQRTLTLAVRLNETRIVGTIQNQRRLTVKTGVKNVTMQFSLYVLPKEASSGP